MLDIAYFLRVIALKRRLKRKKEFDDILYESVVTGSCWLSDLDFNWHMNNSRYLRECDFGRSALLIESGLWNVLVERRKNGMKDCSILVSALQVQYRQSVELGDRFKLVTRINGWDDKAFYLEQTMILDKNGETAFSLLVRFALTPRSLTPQMLVDDLKIGPIQSPPLSTSMEAFKQNYRLNLQKIKSKL